MGIQGLLPFLREEVPHCFKAGFRSTLSGKTVAIDGNLLMSRIHFESDKGPNRLRNLLKEISGGDSHAWTIFSSSTKRNNDYLSLLSLVGGEELRDLSSDFGTPPQRHIERWYSFLKGLTKNKIKPIVVLDGDTRPVEKKQENERREAVRHLSLTRWSAEVDRRSRLWIMYSVIPRLSPELQKELGERVSKLLPPQSLCQPSKPLSSLNNHEPRFTTRWDFERENIVETTDKATGIVADAISSDTIEKVRTTHTHTKTETEGDISVSSDCVCISEESKILKSTFFSEENTSTENESATRPRIQTPPDVSKLSLDPQQAPQVSSLKHLHLSVYKPHAQTSMDTPHLSDHTHHSSHISHSHEPRTPIEDPVSHPDIKTLTDRLVLFFKHINEDIVDSSLTDRQTDLAEKERAAFLHFVDELIRGRAGSFVPEELLEDSIATQYMYLRTSISPPKNAYEDLQQLLNLMGIPTIKPDAGNPYEAEGICSTLVNRGLADFVCSEDTDVLLYDAPLLRALRFCPNGNLYQASFRKKDNREGISTVRYSPELVLPSLIKEGLQFTQEQFVDFSLMCGTDFTSRIRGIGPKKAFIALKEFGSLENVLAKSNIPSVEDLDKEAYMLRINAARKVFATQDNISTDVDVSLRPKQADELKAFLTERGIDL